MIEQTTEAELMAWFSLALKPCEECLQIIACTLLGEPPRSCREHL